MIKLIPAEMSAKLTSVARSRTSEKFKTHIIKKINIATAIGDYYVHEYIPDYWNIEEFKSFWHFFADKGYELSIAGVTDFAIASELYIDKVFRGLTISWGDDS